MEAPLSGAGWKRPSILFVGWEQFGYHVDTYEYCRQLGGRVGLTCLCVDEGLPRKELPDVEVVFCGPPILGRVEPRLAIDAIGLLRRRAFDAAIIQRTKFAFLPRVVCRSVPMVFDVRTGSIAQNPTTRRIENAWIHWNARCFSNVTAISEGLVRQLRLPGRTWIVPLGANPTPHRATPVREELRLVYIGTFVGRCLDRVIDGLGLFSRRHDGSIPVSFSLVGFGSADERGRLEDAVRRNCLESRVTILDRIDHDRVPELLSGHNVGIAFTPREPWYEHQPSTKIFEYLQSGLLCIATDNEANRQVITATNGVLVDDSPEGVCRGLESAVALLARWHPDEVVATVEDHTWERIVNTKLVPLLDRMIRTETD